MPVKLTCPKCGAKVPLTEPLPLPGSEVQCTGCASGLAVSYPQGVMDKLRERGKRFAEPGAARRPAPRVPTRKAGRRSVPAAPPPPPAGTDRVRSVIGGGAGTFAATEIDRTYVEPTQIGEPEQPSFVEIDRTIPAIRSPYGGLPNNAHEPETHRTLRPPPEEEKTTRFADLEDSLDTSEATARPERRAPMSKPAKKRSSRTAAANAPAPRKGQAPKKGRRGALGCLSGMATMGLAGVALGAVAAAAAAGGGYWYYSQDLPSIEALQAYEPATVTVVTDAHGEIMGEIFEQRRYVVSLDQIPDHVQNAFLAAEDANFWNHGGIDYMGIARAMGRNLAKGRMAQGASTITQQVARNFLLTKDKKIERKIKEIILSWRIEEAYSKEHILYLYLNEIFLGSQAYGVEAASRAYFGKSVADISVAEAAILAGLPQRPSDYSPHRHWRKAKERQSYVVGQMIAKGYLTEAEGQAALAEEITIVPRGSAFLEQAPHFTEHVRRYLVERYGEERVLNEGLQVRTTCDLELQRVAQEAVTRGVHDADQRMGFRRDAITHLTSDTAIEQKRAEHEKKMRAAWAAAQDAAGRVAEPETSILEAGQVLEAVVLEVKPSYARVGIGEHEGIIPLGWSDWVYHPNPRLSWRFRDAKSLTEKFDLDGDGSKETQILQRGDVVLVKIEALSTQEDAVAKTFRGTPGAERPYVAIRLWQTPEVESALLSMDVSTGAVRAMVGGADFTSSQFNRAVQSRRQVGSTFKPIVYGAAIETRKVTTASIVADAPLAFATSEEFVWKPANYGHDYLGNITLRKALAMSRNTSTVRVLEAMDPGMNDDVVYTFARKLGIGGAPLHTLPEDFVPKPDNDLLCPWTLETRNSTICMDRFPPKDPNLSNTRHRQQLKPGDEYWCRSCDMSMGLGSASLTMEELVRAYSAFATDGQLVEPYYVEEVRDRHGKILESREPARFAQVIDPETASITRWLLRGVVEGGTGYDAQRELGLQGLAGKTGTTNDEKDAWFVGFTNDVITAVWVGFDQPRTLGVSSTGGRTALPIWIDYMRVAAPKDQDRPFRMAGEIEWAQIDEATGRRVKGGGRAYPFIRGTAPEASGMEAGQVSLQDLTTEF